MWPYSNRKQQRWRQAEQTRSTVCFSDMCLEAVLAKGCGLNWNVLWIPLTVPTSEVVTHGAVDALSCQQSSHKVHTVQTLKTTNLVCLRWPYWSKVFCGFHTFTLPQCSTLKVRTHSIMHINTFFFPAAPKKVRIYISHYKFLLFWRFRLIL